MLLFGNKLSAAADNNDMKVLSTDIQKGMLKALSNQEKLLLVELQRTRKQIVDELDKLQVKSGSNEEDLVKQTIRNYEEEDLSPTRGTSAASVLKKTGEWQTELNN